MKCTTPNFCGDECRPPCDFCTEDEMAQALSGCAVRAAIQQEVAPDDAHYLGAIKIRLETLYELTEAPNIREQINDEISWVCGKLGVDG